MEKSLSERVKKHMSECVTTPTPNRSNFLALKSEIETTINEGFSYLSIWETLFTENKIQFSYPTFARYINRYIQPIKLSKDQKRKAQIPKDLEINSATETEIEGMF